MNELIESICDSLDPEDLITLLEIDCAELLERFPDKLEEHASKFGVDDDEG